MGDFIVWNEKFSVQVPSLDNEHKRIVDIINRLYTGKMNKLKFEDLSKIFDDLINYAMTHFTHEETLMERYDYSERKRHRLEHREYVKKVDTFKRNAEIKLDVTTDLFEFAKNWWINHIQIEDRKFIPLFVAKGAK